MEAEREKGREGGRVFSPIRRSMLFPFHPQRSTLLGRQAGGRVEGRYCGLGEEGGRNGRKWEEGSERGKERGRARMEGGKKESAGQLPSSKINEMDSGQKDKGREGGKKGMRDGGWEE